MAKWCLEWHLNYSKYSRSDGFLNFTFSSNLWPNLFSHTLPYGSHSIAMFAAHALREVANVIHGGFGRTWGHNFLHEHSEWVETRNLIWKNFYSRLRIKVTALWSFPIGSHAFAMFAKKKKGPGEGTLTTLYQTPCLLLLILDACLHCMALLCPLCGGFRLLSVWSPCYTLSRKK